MTVWVCVCVWVWMCQSNIDSITGSIVNRRPSSEVVVLTGGVVVRVVARVLPGVLRPIGASRRTAAHPPQLVSEGPPPAAGLANGTQQANELRCLLPIRSSLALAPPSALLAHGGQHLANVGGQKVVHLVALWGGNTTETRRHYRRPHLEQLHLADF